ncbi:unnamed protein product [Lota lota]
MRGARVQGGSQGAGIEARAPAGLSTLHVHYHYHGVHVLNGPCATIRPADREPPKGVHVGGVHVGACTWGGVHARDAVEVRFSFPLGPERPRWLVLMTGAPRCRSPELGTRKHVVPGKRGAAPSPLFPLLHEIGWGLLSSMLEFSCEPRSGSQCVGK